MTEIVYLVPKTMTVTEEVGVGREREGDERDYIYIFKGIKKKIMSRNT